MRPMRELEKWLARVLLLNSGLALAVSLGLLGQAPPARMATFGVALLGFLAALLSLRRHRAGAWGGMLYYLPQVLIFHRFDGGWQFSLQAGVSLGVSLRVAEGVLVVNLLALVLLAVTAVVCYRRARQPATAS
ncbi:hypothetical protein [Duganella lactea]|nr:hypothetical protein [Duganella lactea]